MKQSRFLKARIGLLGEGRGGKTTLAAALTHQPTENIKSTVGITQADFSTRSIVAGSAGWTEVTQKDPKLSQLNPRILTRNCHHLTRRSRREITCSRLKSRRRFWRAVGRTSRPLLPCLVGEQSRHREEQSSRHRNRHPLPLCHLRLHCLLRRRCMREL